MRKITFFAILVFIGAIVGPYLYENFWPIREESEQPVKPTYDAITECYNLKNHYKNDGIPRTILTSASQVESDKVVVIYTAQELRGNDLAFVPGEFTCYLNEKGKVKDNYNLCLKDNEEVEEINNNMTLQQLLSNYPWAKESLKEKLDSLETLQIFDDLNDDGIPELTDKDSQWCGAMNCFYPLFSLDIANKRVREIIDDGLDSNDLKPVLSQKMNGWKMLRKINCGVKCTCYLKEFDKNKGRYQVREEYGGFNFWEVHYGDEGGTDTTINE